MFGGTEVTISVAVLGSGTGTVSSSVSTDPLVETIDCGITAGMPSGSVCYAAFLDAGQGGQFVLTATPAADTRFERYTGCTSPTGNQCTLSFDGTQATEEFHVQAIFGLLPPPGGMPATFHNSSSVEAYLVIPGETPVDGNLIDPGGERIVTIASGVGTQTTFRAYLTPATVAASVTCMVTATAWQGGTTPEISFHNDEGNYLTCASGLVAP